MKKIVGIFVMMLLIATALNGVATNLNNNKPNGPPAIEWSKTFGGTGIDGGHHLQQTLDGGYIIAGWTDSYGAGYFDIYLIKTDENGNEIWSKTKGFSDYDTGLCVRQTSDGGYIIVGASRVEGSDNEIYWIKTDADGNTELETRGPGQPYDDLGRCILQTEDSGYITIGTTTSLGAGGTDIYLNKKNSNLVYEWHQTYGGTGYEYGNWIEKTNDGGYIITGETSSYGAGLNDFWLIKTDINGNKLWDKTYGSSNYEFANMVKQTKDGGYIIVGYTVKSDDTFDIFVIKTDDSGNKDWEKTLDYSPLDEAKSVCQTYDEGYFIVGYTDTNLLAIKLDNDGDVLWDNEYGGESFEYGYYGEQAADGGYIMVGETSSFGAGYSDVWLVKLETLNNRPNKPSGSYDQGNDELVVSTTDPDGDKVRYGVSWDNDGDVDQWTIFYDSGVETRINCGGRTGPVGVIAEDEYSAQSDWTSVNTRNKLFTDRPFLNFLQNIMEQFPLFVRLLRLL